MARRDVARGYGSVFLGTREMARTPGATMRTTVVAQTALTANDTLRSANESPCMTRKINTPTVPGRPVKMAEYVASFVLSFPTLIMIVMTIDQVKIPPQTNIPLSSHGGGSRRHSRPVTNATMIAATVGTSIFFL